MTDQELIQAAKAMLERSYAPFSHYAVGAALLGSDGQVYTGCNIESAAFGATLCAERSAIANAFSHGCRSFVRGGGHRGQRRLLYALWHLPPAAV